MNTKKILGGALGWLEEDYETETSLVSMIAKGVKETVFSSGSIDFKNNPVQAEQAKKEQEQQIKTKERVDRAKAFFQALKEDMERARDAKDKLLFEEEINDIVTNLPTEQKNRLLHYQASYKDRSVYQRAELRRKLIEEQKKSEEKEKQASMPSPAKQPSAIEGAFEGRSGGQGSGTANLSAQAVG